ncbi:hypothetical protein D9M72_532320 [compost metagenome]
MLIGEFRKLAHWGPVSVHRVEAFDRYPWMSLAACVPPDADRLVESLHIIVSNSNRLSLARRNTLVRTRMNQGIIHNQIPALGQCRKECSICCVATTEVDCFLYPEE